jgi:peptidoglycan hydrolase-like protein with peptidoglycan-binding domain
LETSDESNFREGVNMSLFQYRFGIVIIVLSTLACNLSVAGGTPVPAVASLADSTVTAISPTQSLADEPSATLPPPTAVSTLPPPSPLPTDTPIPPASDTPLPNIPDWPLFRNGDTGPEVYAIQYLLRTKVPNPNPLQTDGTFGPKTRASVINFQNQEGLTPDGIVGQQTWSALIEGALVKQGSQGDTTRAVQTLLKFKFGNEALVVDGNFGPYTDEAVRRFQECHYLINDGIVGPQTWQALIALSPGVCLI